MLYIIVDVEALDFGLLVRPEIRLFLTPLYNVTLSEIASCISNCDMWLVVNKIISVILLLNEKGFEYF